MKQHLSVLMLAARSTLFKIVGIFVLMAAAEGALFVVALRNAQAAELYGLEQTITQSRIALACGVGFLLVCTLLSLSGCELSGSKIGYTMGRLSIREETALFWWGVYNTLIFLIFWAVQLLIVLLLGRYYTLQADPAAVSDQTIFLAFYRQKFLHSLLPLDEVTRTVRNVVLIVCLGATSAFFSYRQRRGQKGVAVILLAALTFVGFSREMGSFGNDILIMFVALTVGLGALFNVNKEPDDEE